MNTNMTKNIIETGIYFGDRGTAFRTMIKNFLLKGNLEDDCYNYLIKKIDTFSKAFTSPTANPNYNYEALEQRGDSTGGKFLIDYFYTKYPHLDNKIGVPICARFKINYGSKQSFFILAEKYNMWDFISARNDDRNRNKKSLLEDVFEATLGNIESVINHKFGIGSGYKCAYMILENIFNEIKISLK